MMEALKWASCHFSHVAIFWSTYCESFFMFTGVYMQNAFLSLWSVLLLLYCCLYLCFALQGCSWSVIFVDLDAHNRNRQTLCSLLPRESRSHVSPSIIYLCTHHSHSMDDYKTINGIFLIVTLAAMVGRDYTHSCTTE